MVVLERLVCNLYDTCHQSQAKLKCSLRNIDFCECMCDLGKEVHICGLDGDYLRRPFGEILNLIPICDTYTKLHALCMSCKNGTYASFTKKLTETDNLIEIGSTEMYIPVCRKCYN